MLTKKIFPLLIFMGVLITGNEGWFDIPKSGEGQVLSKEKHSGEFGDFVIQVDSRNIHSDKIAYDELEIGEMVVVFYKVPTVFFWRDPYLMTYKKLE